MTYKPVGYSLTPAPTAVDLTLKIATALLISFSATLVLVHAQAYFTRSLLLF